MTQNVAHMDKMLIDLKEQYQAQISRSTKQNQRTRGRDC
jgi:hypothetical protein